LKCKAIFLALLLHFVELVVDIEGDESNSGNDDDDVEFIKQWME
jgi:hypothetical protein